MGRRPNPLMAEFFKRGAKIGDMSNRYEQTCKRCGEVFPRGRHENMVPHLTKKCPGVNYTERARIIFRLHDVALPNVHPYIDPNFNPKTGKNGNNDIRAAEGSASTQQAPAQTRDGDLDGLNALALVSHNQSATSGYAAANQLGESNVVLDPQLGLSSFSPAPVAGFSLASGAAFPALPHYMDDVAPTTQDALGRLPLVSASNADLSTIAASANATLVNNTMSDSQVNMPSSTTQGPPQPSPQNTYSAQAAEHLPWEALEDTQSLDQPILSNRAVSQTDELSTDVQATATDLLQTGSPASQHLRPIAMNPSGQLNAQPAAQNTLLPPANRQRVRGAFAPERRNQVRAMRKLGACMRCRMLRKNCSPGTPCLTCSSIENPRLWKGSCVRTKLHEQFPLYSAIPYAVVSRFDLQSFKKRGNFAGKVEVFHFLGQKVTFSAIQGTIDIAAQRGDQSSELVEVTIFDFETDNVGLMIERYLEEVTPKIIEQEPMLVMKISLEVAQAVKDRQSGNVPAEKPDNLVAEIIELWVATVLMIDSRLTVFFNKDAGSDSGRTVIDSTMHPNSYRLLKDQFRGAVEKRASELCKNALQHLEARLLVRKLSTNFETFLVAFILMNCVERMCWQYRCWALPNGECPLDGNPALYIEKAEEFAQTIQMLSGLRQLEPKIMADPNTGALVARKAEEVALANWLLASGLTSDLTIHFGPGHLDTDDSRSLDGTFSSPLLQL